MLKSYEATIENGQIYWLNEQPQASSVRIIITVLAEENMVPKTGESLKTLVPNVSLEEKFLQLSQQWRQETGMLSVVSKIVIHPTYQRIIGMGQPVIPLIFRELEREPDHWFWALQSITGENPVSVDRRGDIVQMAAAWLEWGKAHGYRW
jgi:hypothetical protein